MSFLKKFLSINILTFLLLLLVHLSFLKTEILATTFEVTAKISSPNSYYAILKIPKISLNQEIYPLNNTKNNLNKNLLLHELSRMPDNEKSNVIIAGHSGTSTIAYFKNLYKLKIHDLAILYYNNFIYTYEIKEIAYQPKTGILHLKENYSHLLTLITCTKNDNNSQTIYYAELKNKEKIVKK